MNKIKCTYDWLYNGKLPNTCSNIGVDIDLQPYIDKKLPICLYNDFITFTIDEPEELKRIFINAKFDIKYEYEYEYYGSVTFK